MKDILVFEFMIGDSGIASDLLLNGSKRIVDTTLEEGNFFDGFGDGFVFNLIDENSVFAMIPFRSKISIMKEQVIQSASEVSVQLDRENCGRSPKVTVFWGDKKEDILAWFSEHINFENLRSFELGNCRVYFNESGLLLGVHIFRYLDYFWCEGTSSVLRPKASAFEYRIFGEVQELISDYEDTDDDVEVLAKTLVQYSEEKLNDPSNRTERLVALANEIERYKNFWLD